jgi:hypothetical protein
MEINMLTFDPMDFIFMVSVKIIGHFVDRFYEYSYKLHKYYFTP